MEIGPCVTLSAMELYLSSPRGYSANLPRQLRRVTKLYRAGFLNSDSKVWINTNVVSPIFWVLAERASCVWWFDAPTSGTVRLTQDRIRWGPSHDESGNSPHLDFKPSSLRILDDDTRLTFVVDHTFTGPRSEVLVHDGSTSQRIRGDSGYFEHGNIAVLDLPRYDASQAEPLSASRLEYERGQAHYHGVRLLHAGMKQAAKNDVLDNTDRYLVPLDDEVLAALVESLHAFDMTAEAISNRLTGDAHVDNADHITSP